MLYIELGDFVTTDMIALIEGRADFVLDYLRAYVFNEYIIYTLPCFIVFGWIWWPRNKGQRPGRKNDVILLLIIPVIEAALVAPMQRQLRSSSATMDVATVCAIAQLMRRGSIDDHLSYLRPSQRMKPSPASGSDERPNILFIINESWGAAEYEGMSNRMPFLEQWRAKEPQTFFHFASAFANSNATIISVPSMLTGVAPYQSNALLHRLPLIWDWAKAADMETCLVTSHRFTWGGMMGFFFSPGPDFYATAETIKAPLVNDMGIDDLESVEQLCQFIMRSDRRLCAIYNTNALHTPHQERSNKLLDMPYTNSRYDRALIIVDASIARLYDALDQSGKLSNTLVIITGDHGDVVSSRRPNTLPRSMSLYDEIIRVPLIIRVPPQWIETRRVVCEKLSHNRVMPVSNLDILPTIIDLLGLESDERNRSIRGLMQPTFRISGETLL